MKNKFGCPTKQNSSLNKSFIRSSDSSFAFNESQYSNSVSNAPLYLGSISEPIDELEDDVVAKPTSTRIKDLLNMPVFAILTTPYQALFLIMRIFLFTPVFLSLLHVAFSHSGLTDLHGGHWDRNAGTCHYHNQGA